MYPSTGDVYATSGRTLTCERYNPVITPGIENVNIGRLNFLTLSRVGYWLVSKGYPSYISGMSMQMLNNRSCRARLLR